MADENENENDLQDAWGSALEGELAQFAVPAAAQGEPSRQAGRGRPRGTTGSRFLRARMREQADEQAEQAEESEPVPSMHDLRSQSLQKQRQEDVGLKEVFGPMRFLKNVGSTFQRVVSEAFVCCVDSLLRAPRTRAILKADAGADAKSKSVPKEEPQTLAPRSVHSIIYGKALTMSASALTGLDKGSAQEISKSTVQSRMVHAGALALEMSAVMCSSALSSVIEACSKVPNMKPLLFLWRVRYDETPSRVRVANLAEPAGSARVP